MVKQFQTGKRYCIGGVLGYTYIPRWKFSTGDWATDAVDSKGKISPTILRDSHLEYAKLLPPEPRTGKGYLKFYPCSCKPCLYQSKENADEGPGVSFPVEWKETIPDDRDTAR